MPRVEIRDVEELRRQLGREVAVSDWLTVTQERIDLFAQASGDRQWIHVDPARAAAESPFGGAVAHGFLRDGNKPPWVSAAFGVSFERSGGEELSSNVSGGRVCRVECNEQLSDHPSNAPRPAPGRDTVRQRSCPGVRAELLAPLRSTPHLKSKRRPRWVRPQHARCTSPAPRLRLARTRREVINHEPRGDLYRLRSGRALHHPHPAPRRPIGQVTYASRLRLTGLALGLESGPAASPQRSSSCRGRVESGPSARVLLTGRPALLRVGSAS